MAFFSITFAKNRGRTPNTKQPEKLLLGDQVSNTWAALLDSLGVHLNWILLVEEESFKVSWVRTVTLQGSAMLGFVRASGGVRI